MPAKKNLETSLIGRKCRAKYHHMWFDAKKDVLWNEPLPEGEATIVAAYYHREKDGSGGVKIIIESEKGEVLDYYVDSIMLVPQRVVPGLADRLKNVDGMIYAGERKHAHEELCAIIDELEGKKS